MARRSGIGPTSLGATRGEAPGPHIGITIRLLLVPGGVVPWRFSCSNGGPMAQPKYHDELTTAEILVLVASLGVLAGVILSLLI